MRTIVCSIFDASVGAYMAPFFVRSRGEAIRSFADACRDRQMVFGKHPKDFTLFQIGVFDDIGGEWTGQTPAPLINALECLSLGDDRINKGD